MDITTFIGIFVAGGLVVSAILMGGPGLWFINMPSFMIVIGGTMGATFLAYPLSEVMSVFKVVKNVLLQRSQSPYQLITLISDMSKTVKKEGFLSLEQTLGKIEDPFLAKGIMMFVDGAEKSYVEEVMTTDMVSDCSPQRKILSLGILLRITNMMEYLFGDQLTSLLRISSQTTRIKV